MRKEKAIKKIQYAVMQVASVYDCSGIFDEETDATKDKQITIELAIINLQDALKELEL